MKQQETNIHHTDTSIAPAQEKQHHDGTASGVISTDTLRSRGGEERANKWAVLAILAVGVFMATLDSSIVNISLPAIASYFGTPLSGAIEWIIIIYLIVIAGMLLTIGRLADMIGRKPIWATGLAIFTIGSAISGAATSLGMLIAARGLQGLGGAAAGRLLITHHVSPSQVSVLQQTFANGFHITFIVCAAIAAIGVLTSLVRGKEKIALS